MNSKIVRVFFCLSLVLLHRAVQPGPPFITDDPDTTPYKHAEVYLGSEGASSKREFFAELPYLEVDYGVAKNIQLHMILPLALDKKKDKAYFYGPGTIELGVKCRFLKETKHMPQIGFYPLVEIPGNSRKGLGTGKIQLFLPVWLQKSWGKIGQQWVTYGGGGYWFNPGVNNKNYLFLGWVVQRDITKRWYVGLETIYQTKAKRDERDSFAFNVGGGIKLKDDWQLLGSFGKHTGLGQFLYYVGVEHTW